MSNFLNKVNNVITLLLMLWVLYSIFDYLNDKGVFDYTKGKIEFFQDYHRNHKAYAGK